MEVKRKGKLGREAQTMMERKRKKTKLEFSVDRKQEIGKDEEEEVEKIERKKKGLKK